MKMSENLRSLVEAALTDGKITKKEKKVLFEIAEEEGIRKDSFEIYLDSKLHEEKVDTGTDGNIFTRFFRFYNSLGFFGKQSLHAIPIIVIVFCFFAYLFISHPSYKSQQSEIDIYISENKFQEALNASYKSAAPNTMALKVLQAETRYWLVEKKLEMVLNRINEMKKLSTKALEIHDGYGATGNDLDEFTLDEAVNENSLDLIRAYCEQGLKSKAESFANSIKEEKFTFSIDGDIDHSTKKMAYKIIKECKNF